MNAPNEKKIFTWRGKDPIEDERRLTECIADVCAAELFNMNGSLVLFDGTQAAPLTAPVLCDLLSKRITGCG